MIAGIKNYQQKYLDDIIIFTKRNILNKGPNLRVDINNRIEFFILSGAIYIPKYYLLQNLTFTII